ncbi:hypothetical protein DSO57_1001863 [Entomophthora muscae]|uniref:Uncharacterized protein n=1 Tax=Entomophthora muscae TaxID=34485 RepID=A0ACC2TKI0_9FUNG|nr:hypothetical protein DSO57_1001863 [Entomophthora muscae]
MSHLSPAKAMAMISPKDATITADIPRRATILKEDGTMGSEFKVFPEHTPICAFFSFMGHREALFPSTIRFCAAEEVTQKESIGPEASGTQNNAIKSLPWGLLAEYQMLAPIINYQKKTHAKAKQTKNQPMKDLDPDQMDTQEALSFSQATAQ